MLYEKTREVQQLSYQHWINEEFLTPRWFLIVAVLVVIYFIWLKIGDRRRATELLLLGSLAAVAYAINSMIMLGSLGLAEYKVRLFPMLEPLFITSVTISPIILMLAEQYSSSWKGYFLRTGVGLALLNFVLFPIYVALGILAFYNWNVFFHFLVLTAIALGVRAVFLWITGTKQRHLK